MTAETATVVDLAEITPATQTLDASPSDVLSAAFPRHGLMIDPDEGTWFDNTWFSAGGGPDRTPCDAPDCPEHAGREALVVDVVAHLHVNELPAVHPEDLPACLPTRRQMLDDVFKHPLKDVSAAIWATGSAEPGVLLGAMGVTTP